MVDDPAYVFDTNGMVDLGERHYPGDLFGCVWTNIDQALKSGIFLVCHGVIGELAKIDDSWRSQVRASSKPHVIDEAAADIQATYARLAGLVNDGTLKNAKFSDVDLWVLSCGEARGMPIVTRDGPMRQVCDAGIVRTRCLGITDVFRQLGWKWP